MKLTHNCPKCNKPVRTIQSEFSIGNLTGYVYQCGHLEVRTKLNLHEEIKEEVLVEVPVLYTGLNEVPVNTSASTKIPEPTHKELYEDLEALYEYEGNVDHKEYITPKPYIHPSFYSVDGMKCAYSYQIDGIKFAESSELNCLFADAPGIGKTIQSLVSIKRNKVVAEPCGWAVKGSLIFQWGNEFHTWYSNKLADCTLVTSRSHLIKGFRNYIFSIDMLAKEDFVDQLINLGLKTIVIDEVQYFKDSSAKRTKGLIRLIQLGQIKFKLALSGTPIENRAEEYFTILNILAPAYFPSLDMFKKEWLTPVFDEHGKQKGFKLNPLRSNDFFKLTSKWIIRREKSAVLKDLPPLTRDYQIIEIIDKNIKDSYNHTVDLFKNWLNSNVDGVTSQALLGWLAQLRALTGKAKCANAIEWVRDFVESTDESIAIGINHHMVRDTLYLILEQAGIKTLKFSGEDTMYQKADVVRKFTNGETRVLVINSIAGGTGLNLQTCANALVLERQWNSAKEEQFESRFHRDGQKKAVIITYMIAKGTIDEFFHDMVLRKRKILHNTGIGDGIDLDNDIQSLKDLANIVVNNKI